MLDACRAADALPQALAAIDMAMWDLAGARSGRPVCELLRDAPAASIAVNASIAATSPDEAARAAAAAVAAGYSCVKLKVGVGDDRARVAAVREAIGPQTALRLDANGAWSVEEAERALDTLAAYGLELVEEPVRGLEATRELRARVPVRIAIDETAAIPGALTARVADAVCLKISRCGGIGGLLAAASLVRATRRRGLPRLDLRRPARDRGRAARRSSAGAAAGLRPRDARAVRARAGAAARARRRDRRPAGSGPARGLSSAERGGDRGRRLEREAVAGAGHDGQPRAGDRAREARSERDVALVALAGEQRDRHLQLPEPIPHRRHRARARGRAGTPRAAAVEQRRSSRATSSRTQLGSPANSGTSAQRSMKESIEACSIDSARAPSASARAARSCGSSMPALAETRTRRSTRPGRLSAVCRASRPPIE